MSCGTPDGRIERRFAATGLLGGQAAFAILMNPLLISLTILALHAPSSSGAFTSPPSHQRLIGGEPAGIDDQPMTGALLLRVSLDDQAETLTTIFECSSTLIAPDVVLTAAHCLDEGTLREAGIEGFEVFWNREPDLFLYAIGPEIDQYFPEPPPGSIGASSWVAHPEFDDEGQHDPVGNTFDIGLVFLDSPVLDVEPAYVPAENDGLEPGGAVALVGWGLSVFEGGEDDDENVTYVGVKRTGPATVKELEEWEFSTSGVSPEARQCNGDSGGPALRTEDGNTFVVGISSRAHEEVPCASVGAISTRVLAWREWIESEMEQACEDGRRVHCNNPGLLDPPETPDDEDAEGDTDEVSQGDADTDDASSGCRLGGRMSSRWAAMLVLLLPAVMSRRRRG